MEVIENVQKIVRSVLLLHVISDSLYHILIIWLLDFFFGNFFLLWLLFCFLFRLLFLFLLGLGLGFALFDLKLLFAAAARLIHKYLLL